jgi:hypothetical protein
MKLDAALAERFVCPKCQSKGGKTKRFTATGTGLSRILDIEQHQFIAVSCKNCGFTEVYSPDILEEKDDLGTVLDLLFG